MDFRQLSFVKWIFVIRIFVILHIASYNIIKYATCKHKKLCTNFFGTLKYQNVKKQFGTSSRRKIINMHFILVLALDKLKKIILVLVSHNLFFGIILVLHTQWSFTQIFLLSSTKLCNCSNKLFIIFWYLQYQSIFTLCIIMLIYVLGCVVFFKWEFNLFARTKPINFFSQLNVHNKYFFIRSSCEY